MKNILKLNLTAEEYISFCTNRKNLDQKTIKSYRIDLRQYKEYVNSNSFIWYEKGSIESYIDILHSKYKPMCIPLRKPQLHGV